MAIGAAGVAAIGAAGQASGGLMGTIGSAIQASRQNRQFYDNLRHQRYMYSHRYQMQMRDMQKAGLNPILAYKQGAPTGPAGSAIPSGVNIMEGLASSARGVGKAGRDYQEAKNIITQRKQMGAAIDELNSRAATQAASAREIDARTHLLHLQFPAAEAERDFDISPEGATSRKIKRVIENLGPAAAAVIGGLFGLRAVRGRGRGVRRPSRSGAPPGKLNMGRQKANQSHDPKLGGYKRSPEPRLPFKGPGGRTIRPGRWKESDIPY